MTKISKREQQKNLRRGTILDVAERLIRETGGTDFPIRTLAAQADVAFATPFNLFGSKEGLLYSLLARSLDQITAAGLAFTEPRPADRVIETTRSAVASFLADPELLRPLYLVLLSVSHPDHRPRFMARALKFWQTAARAAGDPALTIDDALVNAVAQSMLAHFVGVLELWVHRDISDEQFKRQTVIGTSLLARAIVSAEDSERLLHLAQANA